MYKILGRVARPPQYWVKGNDDLCLFIHIYLKGQAHILDTRLLDGKLCRKAGPRFDSPVHGAKIISDQVQQVPEYQVDRRAVVAVAPEHLHI